MKQKEAGLRKKATPLFSAMAMQMEPIAIMVRLRSARMAAAKFRAAGEKHPNCSAESQIQRNFIHTASVPIKAIAMATRRKLPVNRRKLEPGEEEGKGRSLMSPLSRTRLHANARHQTNALMLDNM